MEHAGKRSVLLRGAPVTRLQPEDFKKFPDAEDEENDLLEEVPGRKETCVVLLPRDANVYCRGFFVIILQLSTWGKWLCAPWCFCCARRSRLGCQLRLTESHNRKCRHLAIFPYTLLAPRDKSVKGLLSKCTDVCFMVNGMAGKYIHIYIYIWVWHLEMHTVENACVVLRRNGCCRFAGTTTRNNNKSDVLVNASDGMLLSALIRRGTCALFY